MMKIIHLSDPHFGAMDPLVAEAFFRKVEAAEPDLVVLSGDLTMRARRRELKSARDFFDRLPSPKIVIPGNHDIPLINQPFDRFFRSFKRYQETFGEELEPELVCNGAHVVCLNSTRAFGFHADWSEGRLSRSQLAAIPRRFSAVPDSRLKILVLHHPLLELQIKGREVVKPLKALLAAIEEAKVDIVMCGHFHRSQIHATGITDAWRAVISQAPTVCSTRLQGEPQGFHEIHFSGQEMNIIHHVFQATDFSEAGFYRFGRGSEGWSYAAGPIHE